MARPASGMTAAPKLAVIALGAPGTLTEASASRHVHRHIAVRAREQEDELLAAVSAREVARAQRAGAGAFTCDSPATPW